MHTRDDVEDATACCCRCVHLDAREVDLLAHVAVGLSNGEIAQLAYCSRQTVVNVLSSAMQKLGARNRVELIARAYATAILEPRWPPQPSGRSCVISSRL